MTRLPRLSAREVRGRLGRLCFEEERQKGSHLRLERASGEVVTVPVHADRELSPGIVREIVGMLEDKFGYSREEAIEFLKTGKPEKAGCPIESWKGNT